MEYLNLFPALPPRRKDAFARELWKILARKADQSAQGDSSIPTERAQELFSSVCYTVSLAPESAFVQGETAGTLYDMGLEVLRQRFETGKELYRATEKTMLPLDNLAYWDTFRAIAGFFSMYRYDLYAHDIPCMIDYPLSRSPEGLFGIDYINAYLHRLMTENIFCARFDPKRIARLLSTRCPDPREQLINIFSPVAETAVCLHLLHADPADLRFSNASRRQLLARLAPLSREELSDALTAQARSLARDDAEKQALLDACAALSPRLRVAILYDTLDNIFPDAFLF